MEPHVLKLWLVVSKGITDRRDCFASGNIPLIEGDQIYLIFVTALWSQLNSTDKKEDLLEQRYPSGSMPLLGGPESFISTSVFKKCGVELAQEGRNAASWKLIWSNLPYHASYEIHLLQQSLFLCQLLFLKIIWDAHII